MLFRPSDPIQAQRRLPERLSNGDPNPIHVYIENAYRFKVLVQLVEELPFQFQIRDHKIDLELSAGHEREITYELRPIQRGDYEFGALNIYVQSPIGLARRRLQFNQQQSVPVYPSFIQMRKFELYAISDRLTDIGIKKIRRIGHTMEFDQIREYV
ncbi:MAG: DUF58 domain-containing protein, partial [Balneolaceae bacterium]|nr:DUF58 domain-containing protein [Balneolaceae bacterium]